MDSIVQQAMEKWPNVPACRGWLALDARGDWWMRDAVAQNAGDFPSLYKPKPMNRPAKGSKLNHNKLIGFIHRNYMVDDKGQWYFQNGPQRVFVDLEATPWVWRIMPNGEVTSHTGIQAQILECVCDELGHVYLNTDIGFGLIHTADTGLAAKHIEEGDWKINSILSTDVPSKYRFVQRPEIV